jgi:ubiquitin-protein ligase
MTPRLRRLKADYWNVWNAYRENPVITLAGVEGDPPERYVLDLHLTGLIPDGEDSFTQGYAHRVEIFLPMDYPRRPPICRMLTPVFHPNIDPQKICIGDHWSAGQTLTQLIARIAEMITYQSYNVKSPLNARAAAWAEQNLAQLPLEKRDFTPA